MGALLRVKAQYSETESPFANTITDNNKNDNT